MSKLSVDAVLEAYRAGRLEMLLDSLRDEDILNQADFYPSQKCLLLAKKHRTSPTLEADGNDIRICCAEHVLLSISGCATKLEFMRMEGDTLFLEGYAGFVGMPEQELSDIRIFLYADHGEWMPCELCDVPVDRVEGAVWLGELIFPAKTFRCTVRNISRRERWSFRLFTEQRGVRVERNVLLLGWRFPLTASFHYSYASMGKWAAQKEGNCLLLDRCSSSGMAWKELRFLFEIACRRGQGKWEAVLLRFLCHTLGHLFPKDIWLISDRINKADDNGEALFRYLKETGKKEHAYFVLRKDSTDYSRVAKYGRTLDYGSLRYKFLHLLSKKIISSAADEYVVNPFGEQQGYYWDILRKKRLVFLQHGIIKDDLSGWLNRYKLNLGMFVASTRPEYESILRGTYWYGKDVVKLTGLPRYDYLESRERTVILVMPTWRKWLADDSTYSRDGWKRYSGSLAQSEYFRFYDALLNHERLLGCARKCGYRICFLPHPNLMSAISMFHRSEGVEFASIHTRYQEAFAECAMVVTDYSSAVFDAAYLQRPVIYCQFDREEFFAGHVYSEGYFDYERDGFGEVEHDLEGTVQRLMEYMEHGCMLKDKYRKRIEDFFAFRDRKNCERVYAAIQSLDE